MLEDIPGRLEVLSRPVTERLQRLATVQQFTDADFVVAVEEDETQGEIITVFREARGIVSECSTKRQFEVFFDLL